jgi:hypothetical protein
MNLFWLHYFLTGYISDYMRLHLLISTYQKEGALFLIKAIMCTHNSLALISVMGVTKYVNNGITLPQYIHNAAMDCSRQVEVLHDIIR